MVLLMWLNLEMKFGTQPESKSSGPQWERRNSRKLLVPPDWRRKTSCGKPSSGSPICNARGRCLSSVQAPDATTSSGPCLRLTQLRTRKGTMRGCSGPSHLFWKGCQVMPTSRQWLRTWLPCLCEWVRLGIRSASRLAPAAFWASWADAPSSSTCSRNHNNPGGRTGGGELQLATRVLDRRGRL